ncbi:fibronectin type III domain-containing protein [Microbacterium sp. 22195]|uniref:fibronectin type III domain-containing protein n=1 Tax=Microbacterium sp. 22195 TaxID=3453891 RepID=UPI003F86AB18
MTDRISSSQVSPYVTFYLEADVYSRDLNAGTTRLVCRLRASKGTGSYYSGSGSQTGSVDGVGTFGSHSASPFLPSGSTGWNDGPFYIDIPMGGALRTVTLRQALRYGNVNSDGTAAFSIAWTPGAPIGLGVDQIGPTSARYRFSGTTDNGSAITGWQAQCATNTAFTTDVQTVASNGTTTFTGLRPGATYYFRSRGSNGIGWGAWSSVQSATTLSGFRIWNGTAWVNSELRAWDGEKWTLCELYAHDGEKWTACG